MNNTDYTVKELATLAKVSIRTLHYYDEIELLKPSDIGMNGYRYYHEEAVLRLQQIMFYRELGFSLKDIKSILDSDDFDIEQALESHRQNLEGKAQQLQTLITTIDATLNHMKGKHSMATKDMFEGFDEATQAAYEEEVIEKWGDEYVNQSRRNWKSYSKSKKQQILAEADDNYAELTKHLHEAPSNEVVQELMARWHQNLRYFYEPSHDVLLGLGTLYTDDPRFRAFFEKFHADLPEFLKLAIEHYVGGLKST